jgi:peptidoglycan hydrolase CwlO-like protein
MSRSRNEEIARLKEDLQSKNECIWELDAENQKLKAEIERVNGLLGDIAGMLENRQPAA